LMKKRRSGNVELESRVEVHLIDGTYELFRHYYALPSAQDQDGREVAAVRGVLASVLGIIRGGATHIAVATDHVIESFRNGLWPGYKNSEGVEPDLLAQFDLLEKTGASHAMRSYFTPPIRSPRGATCRIVLLTGATIPTPSTRRMIPIC
jgi:5'-3' exonuclease, N-terminal resolvase-like domain